MKQRSQYTSLIRLAQLAWPLLISGKAFGNFAELFAASTLTASLGGQIGPPGEAANNYYAPALIANARKIQVSLSAFHVTHKFQEIPHVLIRNRQNSDDPLTYGSIPTDYDDLNYSAIHLVLPIMRPEGLKLGASLFAPMDKLMESQSGDPFLTEYVMYRARSHRGLFHGNIAGPLFTGNHQWNISWSLGVHLGIRLRSRAFSRTNINDRQESQSPDNSSFHSYARIAAKASPVPAAIASLAWNKKGSNSVWALTLQQEMKNKLSFHIEGKVPDPGLAFDMNMDTLAYYDPHLVRLSHRSQLGQLGIYGSLEYQFWENYQTPNIHIHQNPGGNINPSLNFETISPRNILLPKLGLSWRYNQHHTTLFGLAYRPTPLGGDFSGPGNSVDANKATVAAGHQWRTSLFGQDLAVNLSLQYHHLIQKKVVKEGGTMENGSQGEKIGHPGYNIGGHILSASLGLTIDL